MNEEAKFWYFAGLILGTVIGIGASMLVSGLAHCGPIEATHLVECRMESEGGVN